MATNSNLRDKRLWSEAKAYYDSLSKMPGHSWADLSDTQRLAYRRIAEQVDDLRLAQTIVIDLTGEVRA
jgi:hypothetical protein